MHNKNVTNITTGKTQDAEFKPSGAKGNILAILKKNVKKLQAVWYLVYTLLGETTLEN